MKLQYLGDARDAFKWDLLHWICTRSSPGFDELAFVPMLTPDVANSRDGQTPQQWFGCRDVVRPFVASLKKEPRSLDRISALADIEPISSRFRVSIFAASRYVGIGNQRANYWNGFAPERLENAVVFFDPDNGFETKTRHGNKWIRHSELKQILARLPRSSTAVVYQHRSRRKWADLLSDLAKDLDHVHTAVAAYESNLAFVAMADHASTGKRVLAAIQSYAEQHTGVSYSVLPASRSASGKSIPHEHT